MLAYAGKPPIWTACQPGPLRASSPESQKENRENSANLDSSRAVHQEGHRRVNRHRPHRHGRLHRVHRVYHVRENLDPAHPLLR